MLFSTGETKHPGLTNKQNECILNHGSTETGIVDVFVFWLDSTILVSNHQWPSFSCLWIRVLFSEQYLLSSVEY